jgi:hypothetical protein
LTFLTDYTIATDRRFFSRGSCIRSDTEERAQGGVADERISILNQLPDGAVCGLPRRPLLVEELAQPEAYPPSV